MPRSSPSSDANWQPLDPASRLRNSTPTAPNFNGIWAAYIKAQLANVCRAALWWSTFGILSVALLKSDLALAVCRGSFNLALLVAAPMAVAAAEKSAIRPLLINTTFTRMLLWSLAIPGAWIISAIYAESNLVLWLSMTALVFMDGIAVAFANSVDVDCGGLELLAQAYNLPVTHYLRFHYTALHQTVFDLAFMLFTPPCLVLVALLSTKVLSQDFFTTGVLSKFLMGDDRGTFALLIGVGFFFATLSFISLHYYCKIPKKQPRRNAQTHWPERQTRSNGWVNYNEKVGEVLDGLILVLGNPPLKWRLSSLALETALEDAMVSVLLPITGLNVGALLFGTTDVAVAALISAVLVAVGKLGGSLAGYFLTKYWPNGVTGSVESRQTLVNLILLSSLSLILLPGGYYLLQSAVDVISPTEPWVERMMHPTTLLGMTLMLLGIFLFFIFSTAPKIGFASLIQNAISQDELEAAETFGFIGIFVTITDGLLIIGTNIVFYYIGREHFEFALCAVFFIYLLHGLFEWKYGVELIECIEETTLI